MGPTLIHGMLALALCAWAPALVADKKISKELAEMYRQDQEDQNNWAEIGDEEASRRQGARRERTAEIVKAGLLDKPDDFYNAAVVLLCGEDSDQLICAHACSTAASLLGHKLGRELYTVTLDACMRSLKRAPVFDVYTAAKDPERPGLLELHANVRAVFGLRTGKKR